MNRAYSITDWQKDFAKAFAASVPLESMQTQARGALLAADNDEDAAHKAVQEAMSRLDFPAMDIKRREELDADFDSDGGGE